MPLHFLKYLVLPPLSNALLIIAGLLLWKTKRGWSLALIVLGVASLLILSLPWTSYWLRKGLEPFDPPGEEMLARAEAIVILGGGRDYRAPEFGWDDAPNNRSWRRLAYGSWLSRQTDLPILVTGGRVHDESRAEAELMATALGQVFGRDARWVEKRSRNTAENAEFSAAMLQESDVHTILLISQAWHLPRAVPAFERRGLTVIPAPTEFASPPPSGLAAWIPRVYHLRHSTQALHEWLGRGVYALQAWIEK